MDRHMLHQSPVGFSNIPVPVCIELGAVVCSLLCPYVIGKQTNSRLSVIWYLLVHAEAVGRKSAIRQWLYLCCWQYLQLVLCL